MDYYCKHDDTNGEMLCPECYTWLEGECDRYMAALRKIKELGLNYCTQSVLDICDRALSQGFVDTLTEHCAKHNVDFAPGERCGHCYVEG